MRLKLIQTIQNWLYQRNYVIVRPGLETDEPIDVLKLLTDRLGSRDAVTVVQVGANDGVQDDPIHGLLREHATWKAYLIEPQPDVFEQLEKNSADLPNARCINCAIAEQDGKVTLYRIRQDPSVPESISGLASFDRGMLAKQKKRYPHVESLIESIHVPAKTIRTLLTEYGIESIDLLQIDTEGFDDQVLRMVLEAQIRPVVINFESWHLSTPQKEQAASMLRQHGYRFLSVGRDTIAAQASIL